MCPVCPEDFIILRVRAADQTAMLQRPVRQKRPVSIRFHSAPPNKAIERQFRQKSLDLAAPLRVPSANESKPCLPYPVVSFVQGITLHSRCSGEKPNKLKVIGFPVFQNAKTFSPRGLFVLTADDRRVRETQSGRDPRGNALAEIREATTLRRPRPRSQGGHLPKVATRA